MTTRALTLRDSTIGKKVAMAVSGIVLFGFVIGHMIGNLQVFLGPEAFNAYAVGLHGNVALLWGVRGVLLLAVVVHVVTALQLITRNQAARPTAYKMQKSAVTTYAARTMRITGPLLLLQLIYHVLHLTVGVTAGLGYEDGGPATAYSHVISSFSVPWCVAVYSVSQVMLGLHLSHGAWSLFQSLGINHKRYNAVLHGVSRGIGLAVVAGFLAVPIGVALGVPPGAPGIFGETGIFGDNGEADPEAAAASAAAAATATPTGDATAILTGAPPTDGPPSADPPPAAAPSSTTTAAPSPSAEGDE